MKITELLPIAEADVSSFSIDTDPDIKSAELKLLNDRGLIPLKNWYNNLSQQDCNTLSRLSRIYPKTVIYSRSLDAHYVGCRDEVLSVDELKDAFGYTGHTLNIDYEKSYVRYLAFDVDCMCRKFSNYEKHNTFEETQKIAFYLTHVLMQIQLIKQADGTTTTKTTATTMDQNEIFQILSEHCSIWSNECGFHIYTDILVSESLHNAIKQRVLAQIPSPSDLWILEIPTFMPLPYSAKTIQCPYKPCLEFQFKPPLMSPTRLPDSTQFHDLFSVDKANEQNDMNLQKIFEITQNHESRWPAYSINFNPEPQTTIILPIFPHLMYIHPQPQTLISVKHLRQYIETTSAECLEALQTSNVQCVDNEEAEVEEFKSAALTGFDTFRSNNFQILLRSFLVFFNQEFSGDAKTLDDSPGQFITSCLRYGFYDLQHYVVMLHLWFFEHSIDEINFDSFRQTLRTLLPVNEPCIKEFINYYDSSLRLAYNTTSIKLIQYFAMLNTYQISPFLSSDEMIRAAMIRDNGSPKKFQSDLADVKGAAKDKLINLVFLNYCNLLVRFGVVFVNPQTTFVHILNNNVYVNSQQQPTLPDCLDEFTMGNRKCDRNAVLVKIKTLCGNYQIFHSFVTNPFLIQTNAGVFNSITGLYSRRIPFLPFTRKRDYAIWPTPEVIKIKPDTRLNNQVLELQEWTRHFIEFLPQANDRLFTLYLLIPGVLELKNLISVQEHMLRKMADLLLEREKFTPDADFISKYYKVNPMFLFILRFIFVSPEYANFDTLCEYNTLNTHIFKHNSATEKTWEKFIHEEIMKHGNVLYDEASKTYSDPFEDEEKNLCLRQLNIGHHFLINLTIFSIMIAKCNSFKLFTNACKNYLKVDELYTVDETALPDCWVNYTTKINKPRNNEDMLLLHKNNLQLARDMVFGELFESAAVKNVNFDPAYRTRNLLVDVFIIMSFSSYFSWEITLAIFDSISCVFSTTNIHKLMILFKGERNTGKSLAANFLESMCRPNFGRVNDFNKHQKRAQISTVFNTLFLNELAILDAQNVKPITGNDSELCIVFHSTTYELRHTQALLYAATNNVIKFVNCKQDIDKTSVERLYTIDFRGQQTDSGNVSDFLSLMLNQQIIRNTIRTDKMESYAIALANITFELFKQTRSSEYIPHLNTKLESCLRYRDEVFCKNNRLINFLNKCGIQTTDDKFFMNKQTLLRLAEIEIRKYNSEKRKGADGGSFNSIQQFAAAFKDFQSGDLLKPGNSLLFGLQEKGFIDHVKNHLRVKESEDAFITTEDFEARVIAMFAPDAEAATSRDNAVQWMMHLHRDCYDPRLKGFKGIEFVIPTVTHLQVYEDGDPDNDDHGIQDYNLDMSI